MEKTMFSPETLSIKKIFSDSDTFYHMPIYQRPYSWDKEIVEQLWNDILEAYKNNLNNSNIDQNYFLGSIVAVNRGKNFEVVDGQQRLTTLTILFCTLRDMNRDKLIELSERNKKIIEKCIYDDEDGSEKLKLTTHLDNHSSFKTTVIDGISFDKDKENNKFLQTSSYFKDLIERSNNIDSDYYVSDFQDLIDYIFNKVLLIRIKCYDEGFAIKLFSVLNDRGMDLSASDIIKAYLLQNINNQVDRLAFVEVWKRIENLCKYNKESIQNLFNLYLYYYTAENPGRSLQDEYKDKFKNRDPQEIILDIEEFSKKLIGIVSDNYSSDISLLRYLPNKIYWRAILTTAKHVNYQEFDELKNLVMRYYYQSWVAEGTSSRIKQTSFNIIKEIKLNSDINKIKGIIQENLNKYESYKSFLGRKNVYSKGWHKPLLLLLEYNTQEKMSFIEISSDIHTEHILPIGWKDDKLNWNEYFSDEEANDLINSLGNLTLLSGLKNIQASNRNYLSKIDIYEGNDGKGIDGKTRFNVTQEIMRKYPNHWSADTIKLRQEEMIEKIISYLDIS